jgi:hypothetical protein
METRWTEFTNPWIEGLDRSTGPWWTGLRTLSCLLIVATSVGFDGWERKRLGQRRLWATRLGYTAAGSPETDRNGKASGDVGEALEGRR